MDATIKIKVSELNMAFIERLKSLFSDKEDGELIITYSNGNSEYLDKLRKSKKQLEDGKNLISFTLEELESYNNTKKAG